jgi:hypothetical protein
VITDAGSVRATIGLFEGIFGLAAGLALTGDRMTSRRDKVCNNWTFLHTMTGDRMTSRRDKVYYVTTGLSYTL